MDIQGKYRQGEGILSAFCFVSKDERIKATDASKE
jgi:hypothetical protein